MKKIKVFELLKMLEQKGYKRGAWSLGVYSYACELLDNIENKEQALTRDTIEKYLLNGASNWHDYSYSGCGIACMSNYAIALALCSPSQFKKKKEGELQPNKSENWLDVQARALFQACELIKSLFIII